jgi:hypothetical protein
MGWPGTGAEVLVQRLAGPVAEGQRALAAGEERLQILATGADQALEQLTTRGNDPQRQRTGMLRLRRQEQEAGVGAGAVAVARQQADRAAEAELALRRHQQARPAG